MVPFYFGDAMLVVMPDVNGSEKNCGDEDATDDEVLSEFVILRCVGGWG